MVEKRAKRRRRETETDQRRQSDAGNCRLRLFLPSVQCPGQDLGRSRDRDRGPGPVLDIADESYHLVAEFYLTAEQGLGPGQDPAPSPGIAATAHPSPVTGHRIDAPRPDALQTADRPIVVHHQRNHGRLFVLLSGKVLCHQK